MISARNGISDWKEFNTPEGWNVYSHGWTLKAIVVRLADLGLTSPYIVTFRPPNDADLVLGYRL
jgi:hypothetical protein